MRKGHMSFGLLLLLSLAGPAWANTVWSTFGDPDLYFAGSTYPVRWIANDHGLPNGVWRMGDAQGSVDVIDGQVRLMGNGIAGISGGLLRYDDIIDTIYGVNNDVSLEFTIPDFAAVRNMPEVDFPGLQVGVWTGAMSFFGIKRDVGGETWRFIGYDNQHQGDTMKYGDALPGNVTAISIRFARTGNAITMDAAYNDDITTATEDGFLQEGTFHQAFGGYTLSVSERTYISLRVIWAPSRKTPTDNTYGAIFIDNVVLSGPFVPKKTDTPGVTPSNFGGPDWPALTISADAPSGGWYEAGDRFEYPVTLLKGIYPPEFQWLRSDTAEGTPEEISGATDPELVIDPLTEADSGSYWCRVTNSQVKTQLLTEPVSIVVVPAGSLPAIGVIGLCVVALACILLGIVVRYRVSSPHGNTSGA